MARPAKAITTQTRHNTKTEIANRKLIEDALKGDANNIEPPDYLSGNQEIIFNSIVAEFKTSGILSNKDIYILVQISIAIDRLQTIEKMINDNPELLCDSKLMSAKEKYSKDFYRCCNELSLSPQSRAKMSSINKQTLQENNNPLLKVLRGGKVNDKTTSGI